MKYRVTCRKKPAGVPQGLWRDGRFFPPDTYVVLSEKELTDGIKSDPLLEIEELMPPEKPARGRRRKI